VECLKLNPCISLKANNLLITNLASNPDYSGAHTTKTSMSLLNKSSDLSNRLIASTRGSPGFKVEEGVNVSTEAHYNTPQ
jgi:hypothetical protein